jgi:hypothetical protein
MISVSDPLRVRFFSQSLTGPAFGWYTSLGPDSIRTWKQLEEQFHIQYHSEATEVGIANLGTSTAKAWADHGGIYPTLQRGQELMLLLPYFREGGGRVGILGIAKADQESGFSIGVQFFGTLGAKVNNI